MQLSTDISLKCFIDITLTRKCTTLSVITPKVTKLPNESEPKKKENPMHLSERLGMVGHGQ